MGCRSQASRGQAGVCEEMCAGSEDQRGRSQGCPAPGPSGLGCPVPFRPTVPLHTPAVHNDGAGTASVALVHLPATGNGCEGQGAPAEGKGDRKTHLWASLSLFFFSPHMARTEEGRGVMVKGKEPEMVWVALGLPCYLQALCPKCSPGTTDLSSLSLSFLTCKTGMVIIVTFLPWV